MCKLRAHVTQPAETDHANLLAFGDAPVAHGRICCDASAEERCGPGEIEVGGDSQNEVFIDDDAIGVATVGDASEVLVRGVEGERQVRAEILKPNLAPGAGAVRVDEAADRGELAGLVLGNCCANFGDTPDDLMAWDNRVDSGHELAPLVADRMEIRVADAAEQDFNLNVVFGWVPTRDRCGGKRRCRTPSGVSLRVVHNLCSCYFPFRPLA